MKREITLRLDFIPATIGEAEMRLIQSLIDAHCEASWANAGNASNLVCAMAAAGSGSFTNAIAAALLCTGAIHAPLIGARKILREATAQEITEALTRGQLIPGFGHSFFRDQIDPAFKGLMTSIESGWPAVAKRIVELREAIWAAGKRIWPNAALLTAAVCEIAKIPDGLEICFFALPRLPVWAKQAVGGEV